MKYPLCYVSQTFFHYVTSFPVKTSRKLFYSIKVAQQSLNQRVIQEIKSCIKYIYFRFLIPGSAIFWLKSKVTTTGEAFKLSDAVDVTAT